VINDKKVGARRTRRIRAARALVKGAKQSFYAQRPLTQVLRFYASFEEAVPEGFSATETSRVRK